MNRDEALKLADDLMARHKSGECAGQGKLSYHEGATC